MKQTIQLCLIVALTACACAPADDPCEGQDTIEGDWQCRERFCWADDLRAPVCEAEDALMYNPYYHCLIETNGPGDEECGRWYGRDRGGEWSGR